MAGTCCRTGCLPRKQSPVALPHCSLTLNFYFIFLSPQHPNPRSTRRVISLAVTAQKGARDIRCCRHKTARNTISCISLQRKPSKNVSSIGAVIDSANKRVYTRFEAGGGERRRGREVLCHKLGTLSGTL